LSPADVLKKKKKITKNKQKNKKKPHMAEVIFIGVQELLFTSAFSCLIILDGHFLPEFSLGIF